MKQTKLNLRSIRMIRMNKALDLRGVAAISGFAVSFKRVRKPTSGELPNAG
jgi:hypothetical protein